MRNFEVINREYINPVDLTVLGNTFNTLGQGHLKTIEKASNLQATLANLDLNEAENEWRKQKLDNVRQTIENNSNYGNAYSALDDIIKLEGDIKSDAGLIGRLKAQQDYKAYVDNLDKRTDLTEDTKRYFREKNQYYYTDTVNDKGQIIGGSKWQPTEREVSKYVPMSDVLTKALSWAAKESGGMTQVTFLDEYGNPTTDPSKSVTGEIYTKTATGWQKLSKDKLNSAIEAAINNIPGARESIAQDYKVAEWKHKKGEDVPEILDKNGYLLTPQQYQEKRINPFVDAATYYNQTNSIDYGNALKAQIALSAQLAAANTPSVKGGDISTTLSNPITIRNTMPAEAYGAINSAKQDISNILGKDISNNTYVDIKSIIDSSKLSTEEKLKVYSSLDIIKENEEYVNGIKSGLDKDSQDQFEAYNAITSLGNLPNNKYGKEWSERVNKLFGTAESIRQYFSDTDSLDAFYLAIGGKEKAKSLGIKEGSSKNGVFVELPADYKNSIISFAQAGNVNEHSSSVVRIDNEGNEHQIIGDNKSLPDSPYMIYAGLLKYYNNLQKTNDDIIGDNGNITLSNVVVNAETPSVAEILALRKSNPEEAKNYTQVLDDEQKEAFKSVSNIDLVQTGAYELGNNNTLQAIDSERRKEITALLRSAKTNDLDITAIQDPMSGNWGMQITIKGVTDENGKLKREPITFYTPGGVNSQTYDSWNTDTAFRAKNDVNKYKQANRPITIATPNIFGTNSHIKLESNGYGFNVIEGGAVIKQISNSDAIELRDNYLRWTTTINAINSGIDISIEAFDAIAVSVATNIAKLYNNNPSEELINYYYDNLTKNLY